MEVLFYVAVGAVLTGIGLFIFQWVKKGWAWGVAKLKAWWSKGKADLAALDTRLKTVEADVATLKTKASTPAPAPAPTPAPTPAA
jgi:hypothetical protein